MKILKLSVVVLAVLFFSCNHDKHKNHELSSYAVTSPLITDTIINQEFICQVRSIQHIEIRALDEGYLQNIFVDEGQFVKQGQLLFQLMPLVYQAELQKAQAELNKAEIEYQNTKALADSNIVSKNELALSKANLEKAKAELKLAEAHYQFTQIKAPFNGIIGRFNDVRIGSLLEEGELLTTLSDNSKMWVYFNVPEAVYLDYARKNALGKYTQEVQLQLADGQIYEYKGVIETIESDFNNETGNIAFRATFQNPHKILRHGQTGKVLMPFTLTKAMLIPQEATFEVLDKKYVYVVKDGIVTARQITVGNEMTHLYEVTKGLNANDTILIDGLRKVKNGDKIIPEFRSVSSIVEELNKIDAE